MDADWILINKMHNGDEAAIDAFVRKYYPSILKYCFYRISDNVQAEDLAQETFYRFFKAFSTYSHKGKLANYLYVIAGNLCRDYWRKEKSMQFTELTEDVQTESDAYSERMAIEDVVDRLPQELRDVIYMHYFLDMKLKEIAKAEGIGLSLVKYRLKRGKELLKSFLEKENKA